MKTLPTILFAIYLVILVKLILFKGNVFYQVVPTSDAYINQSADSSLVSVNLIPFKTISNFLEKDASFSEAAFNVLGNIILFIPFGFLLPLVFKTRLILFDIFYTALLLSLSFELIQFLTRTGQFDIDDIILNTTGGLIGYLLLRLVEEVMARRKVRRLSASRSGR